ncbi:hypothetical protein ALC57_03068 [Trachymyrmex cornetzi]|uniref:Uncharacterized protein n=1 Tax=Trachymyrmex cornetzi TaxID=471704 RepID=A0A151JML3_9HYME|nr:hypothetical protein ALC57_03068 [Trachymyrmex cornetzi]
MMLEYAIELETLTDAILLARRGLLHPKILTPNELFYNLKETRCNRQNNVMICRQTDLLYQVSAIYNCESELLKSARLENILKECDVRIMRIHTVWYQLKTTNSWLYTAPRNETLHILCKDNKPRRTLLYSTGLIRLSADCGAISDNALLRN